jgi:hypothetical protein
MYDAPARALRAPLIHATRTLLSGMVALLLLCAGAGADDAAGGRSGVPDVDGAGIRPTVAASS